MNHTDEDRSPPERDRTANRRWMIGIVVTLVFGIFGAVMALLAYRDRNRQPDPQADRPLAPAARAAPGGDPAPAERPRGKGHDKK